MPTFREFLAERAEHQKEHLKRRAERDEWVAAVGRLVDQVRAWLAEADPDGVLEVRPTEVAKAERGLGMYAVPALKIGLAGKEAQVTPLARNVLGQVDLGGGDVRRAVGRVDISGGGRSYKLYRVLDGQSDVWFDTDEPFRPRRFDRPRLEAILQDLLP